LHDVAIGDRVVLPPTRREARVSAVMLEINRGLYMDEATGQKTARFPETLEIVQAVVTALVSC
jgi:hypothetical protein